MVLRNIESALERLVEGTFSRAFKAELQPVELGRQLMKELDTSRKLDVNGRSIAPNSYLIQLCESDFEQFQAIEASLVKELSATIREYARTENLGFVGPVDIEIESDPKVKVGFTRIYPSFDSPEENAESHCVIEGKGGLVYPLYNRTMTIGRHNECDIVIDDENISRRHAELAPSGDSFELMDLGSTNGCKVNGERSNKLLLTDGDEIKLGPVKLWFRAS